MTLPFALALALLLLSLTPRVQSNATLMWSFVVAALVLFAWLAVLFVRLGGGKGGTAAARTISVVVRKQHYIQAAVQASVYVYWGYHWPPVYDHALLIIGQLLFAYALDILLSWSRRTTYVLGFGAFPIVFSTNLFLWFRDDWFYMQFLLIAAGVLGKEFIRWNRDGKSSHVFNPSAFTLALFSLVLLSTGTTDLTWGQQIASTLTLAPHIYLWLFGIGLVVMYFFSITLVAGTAAAMLFAGSAIYTAVTGVPYFLDSEIPAAVFLGLHLLVTDPSTSPRTPVGKAIFGAMYGLGVLGFYGLLGSLGAPTFYDKLLCVPLLNLSVKWIDARAAALESRIIAARDGVQAAWLRSNVAHMGVWILFFAAMTAMGKTEGKHTGDSLPFWVQACEEDRATACQRLISLESTYCADRSAWACNELGVNYADGKLAPADAERAKDLFAQACELRMQTGCDNLMNFGGTPSAARAPPKTFDLRLLLREGGRNLMDWPEGDLYARACEHGWEFACGSAPGLR